MESSNGRTNFVGDVVVVVSERQIFIQDDSKIAEGGFSFNTFMFKCDVIG